MTIADPPQWTGLQTEYRTGRCIEEGIRAQVWVFVVDEVGTTTEEHIAGRFYSDDDGFAAIVLENAGINEVAHEVSHYVDWTLKEKGIRDSETRAYMQGYFTECVMSEAEEGMERLHGKNWRLYDW